MRSVVGDSWPVVTIAIPTYNRADSYLQGAIEAALSQTYPYLDIIVSDNASTDGTATLVNSFTDTRLRYFRHERNIGANGNANFCLERAEGDYFLLLHDDDLVDADFVETCIRAAGYQRRVGIIRTGVRIIDPDGSMVNEHPNMVGGLALDAFMRGWFAGKAPIYLCNTLFGTAALRENGGLRSKHQLVEDGVAVFQLAARFGRVDVQEVKASFRRHPTKMGLSARVSDWCEDYLDLLDIMCDLVSENRELVKTEGMRALSRSNYNRAMEAKSPLERLAAYLTVFKKFSYRYPPSAYHLSYLLYGTPVYDAARAVKRKLAQFA